MRFITQINIPHEPFNTFVREGVVGQKINRIIEITKPESIYFTEQGGRRAAVAVYTCSKPSDIPSVGEPWFLTFEAECQFRIAMTPQDLGNAGLESIGKTWS